MINAVVFKVKQELRGAFSCKHGNHVLTCEICVHQILHQPCKDTGLVIHGCRTRLEIHLAMHRPNVCTVYTVYTCACSEGIRVGLVGSQWMVDKCLCETLPCTLCQRCFPS